MKQLISVLIALLLAACQVSKVTAPTVQPITQTPRPSPEAEDTATLLPTSTPQAPRPTLTVQPDTSGASSAQVKETIALPQPFQDCTLWPMLVGCARDAVPLAGRIAFYDKWQQQLTGIDLTSGAAWQVPLKAPLWIEWSPDGQELLAPMRAQSTDPDAFNNLTFDAQGHVVSQSIDTCIHFWEAEGAAPKKCKDGFIVTSSSGAEAWTEKEPQTGEWSLLVRSHPDEKAKAVKMTVPPYRGDYFYRLHSWLPNSPYLILFRWKDTTSGVRGMPLYIVDSRTGQTEDIRVGSQLAPRTTVITGDLLITVDMAPNQNSLFGKDFPKLVLYNWRSRERAYPLPGTMVINHLAVWPLENPEWIAFTVDTHNIHSPEAEKVVSRSGVYLFNIKTGDVKPVDNSDGAYRSLQWTNNGAVLLYGALPDQPVRQGYAELRAYRLEDQAQWMIGYIPYDSIAYIDEFLGSQYLTYSDQ